MIMRYIKSYYICSLALCLPFLTLIHKILNISRFIFLQCTLLFIFYNLTSFMHTLLSFRTFATFAIL